ncbi:hypothetical protein B296_00048168 [Ensete ventricosum]|uniref:Uncharacterized protein n=1 Tax=Ensete ventricosum TaxID=4639 RepID=A0A426XU39_ENSVE|nr:hypothetical protein B296_00048168 [Ensete ventricosum]
MVGSVFCTPIRISYVHSGFVSVGPHLPARAVDRERDGDAAEVSRIVLTRRSPVRHPRPQATLLPREETKRLPTRGERSWRPSKKSKDSLGEIVTSFTSESNTWIAEKVVSHILAMVNVVGLSVGLTGRHDVVRPVHVESTQRDTKLGEDRRRSLGSGCRSGQRSSSLFCVVRPLIVPKDMFEIARYPMMS